MVKAEPALQDVLFTPNPDSYLNEHSNPLDALKRIEPSDIEFSNPAEDLV